MKNSKKSGIITVRIFFNKLIRIWNILLDKDEMGEKALKTSSVNGFMCKACELAKVVTNECYDRNYSVSAAKLQKLLVLMHGEHLASYDKNLFPENVLCWKCGVAIKEVELKFLLHDFSKNEKLPEHIAVLKTEEAVIKKVLDKYGHMDVLEINNNKRLLELTRTFPYVEGKRVIIPNEAIKKVFLTYDEEV